MDYISALEAAKKWGITDRQVRTMCIGGKIKGSYKSGRAWLIPVDAVRPSDGRTIRFTTLKSQSHFDFSNIDNLKKELDSKRPLTTGEVARLRDEFLIDFTYNSNAIEGNTLTLQETAMIINEGITIGEKPLKDHLEVIGHKEAFMYIEELVKDKVQLSEREIKNIHSLVLMDKPEDKGVYRRLPVMIMGAKHTPPQPYLVPVQMEQILAEYEQIQKSMHITEAVALFHIKFEGVHPFIDGNGRSGRLILNLELMKAGYPPINVKFSDRRKYYDAFNDYHTTGSHSKMTELIAGYIEGNLKKYNNILK
jgi:Fic family protein